MASEIKLPKLGENVTGGDVLDIKVAPGDTVAKGQTLLEVEAEKSTVEVPSPLAGRITELRVKKGETIQEGQTLCLIDGSEAPREAAEESKPKAQEKAASPPPAAKPRAPTGNGREQEPKKPAAEPRREPAPPATGDGQHREAATPAPTRIVPAGPATRRLARELGVDLSQVRGSASGGRVTAEDVKAHVRALAAGTVSRGAPGQTPPLPDFTRWGEVERRPLDGIRKKTAEQMSLAWSLVAHVTQHDQADITELEAGRKQHEGRGPKLTVTAFALKAAAIALQQFPQFNSSLDLPGGQLLVKRYIHIGVAVDTERGLLVPVIRDVDKKSISQLAQELAEVAEHARQKKLGIEDMRGGTFTITNLGGIGGTGFTPIVNYPEVAILGLARSRLQPVVHNGQVTPRLILPLSLSYDHRVIDGADGARFTRRIAEMLENPLVMLLHA
jgi:pyruvate dehydrogenase E2 component (dihydrolipoamide acetyltransferase)